MAKAQGVPDFPIAVVPHSGIMSSVGSELPVDLDALASEIERIVLG